MTLTWAQIDTLAAALNAAHPDVDRLSLTSEHMVGLINGLNTGAVISLSDEEANAIKWQWMKRAEQPVDDGRQQAGGRG